ncbi:MAG TPA: hypothetical protein VD928_01690, partial [Candidatus Paceibacterota bacterium]|nr:hypothetical protein [Candidatus Paceibacterota bacterium]
MISQVLNSVLDIFLPPRSTQIIIERLSFDTLLTLKNSHTLPYRHKAVTALIWEIKYNANPKALALAGQILQEELLSLAEDELSKIVVIPVPMHPKRRSERGFNQTELICEAAFDNEIEVFEYMPHALLRMHHTPPQQTLPRRERLKNMQSSMAVNSRAKIKGRVCVVVDDVATTGATL